MTQKNALSRRQFRQSGFDETDYAFNTQPGTFLATIDCKRWGKGKKLDLCRRQKNRCPNLAPEPERI